MTQKRNKTNDFRQRTITELLRTIRKDEIKQLTNYMTVYGTLGARNLWKVLKPKHPHFNITDDYLRNAVRPNKTLTEQYYRVQLSELTNLTKAFIAEKEFKNNELLYANTLAMGLIKRQAKLNYRKTHQRNKQLFEVDKKPDFEQYQHLCEYHKIDFQFNLLYHPMKVDSSLQLASDNHDYSFIINKLRFLIAMRNRSRVVNTRYNNQNEKEFINYISKFPLDNLPLIKAYYLALQLFQRSSYTLFVEYKEHVFSIRHQFKRNEIRQLLTLAINFCVWNIEKGKLEFLEERFAITKINVEEQYLKVLGHFSNNHFRATLRDAIEAKQLSWAYDFLKTKLPLTHPDYRTNLELLGWAYWYFAKGDFAKQQAYLKQIESKDYIFKDFYNDLAFRVLKLKTDFALLGKDPGKRLKESFNTNLNGFFRYCERKEGLSESTRKSRINFGKALRLIFNKQFGKKQISEQLEPIILNMEPITELPWLLANLPKQTT